MSDIEVYELEYDYGEGDQLIDFVTLDDFNDRIEQLQKDNALLEKVVEALSFLVTEIDFAYDKDEPVLIYSGRLDEYRALINSIGEDK